MATQAIASSTDAITNVPGFPSDAVMVRKQHPMTSVCNSTPSGARRERSAAMKTDTVTIYTRNQIGFPVMSPMMKIGASSMAPRNSIMLLIKPLNI
ncbi:hypothetical protein [Paraburkholderia dilworthii]|uniref:hypothetical protein n=1 Tax=Paraburkholderia dilworthii TaxID=948106 RepID=UPI000483713B|nr:hypothetical protein [Paraburkholderia dilworthii]